MLAKARQGASGFLRRIPSGLFSHFHFQFQGVALHLAGSRIPPRPGEIDSGGTRLEFARQRGCWLLTAGRR